MEHADLSGSSKALPPAMARRMTAPSHDQARPGQSAGLGPGSLGMAETWM